MLIWAGLSAPHTIGNNQSQIATRDAIRFQAAAQSQSFVIIPARNRTPSRSSALLSRSLIRFRSAIDQRRPRRSQELGRALITFVHVQLTNALARGAFVCCIRSKTSGARSLSARAAKMGTVIECSQELSAHSGPR